MVERNERLQEDIIADLRALLGSRNDHLDLDDAQFLEVLNSAIDLLMELYESKGIVILQKPDIQLNSKFSSVHSEHMSLVPMATRHPSGSMINPYVTEEYLTFMGLFRNIFGDYPSGQFQENVHVAIRKSWIRRDNEAEKKNAVSGIFVANAVKKLSPRLLHFLLAHELWHWYEAEKGKLLFDLNFEGRANCAARFMHCDVFPDVNLDDEIKPEDRTVGSEEVMRKLHLLYVVPTSIVQQVLFDNEKGDDILGLIDPDLLAEINRRFDREVLPYYTDFLLEQQHPIADAAKKVRAKVSAFFKFVKDKLL